MLAPARRSDRVLSLLLLAADAVSVPAIFFLTYWLRAAVIGGAVPGFDVAPDEYLHTIPAIWILWTVCFAWAGLYRPRRYPGSMGEAQKSLKALAALMISMMAASYLAQQDYSRLMLLLFIAVALPVGSLARLLARRIAGIVAPVSDAPRILIVGTGEVAVRVWSSLEKLPSPHPEVVGFISADSTESGTEREIEGIPVAGTLSDLPRLLVSMRIDEVFFASPRLPRGRILEVISAADKSEVHFRMVSDLFEISSTKTDLDDLARLPIIEIGHSPQGLFSKFVKRMFDIVFSLLLIVLLLPFLLLIHVVLLLGRERNPRLQADEDRQERGAVRLLQVQDDETRIRRVRGRPPLAGRPQGHPFRQAAPADEPRRTASALQRPQGQHEPRGTQAGDAFHSFGILGVAAEEARSQAGDHRTLADNGQEGPASA